MNGDCISDYIDRVVEERLEEYSARQEGYIRWHEYGNDTAFHYIAAPNVLWKRQLERDFGSDLDFDIPYV